jgi:HrpA-like RNA helicase
MESSETDHLVATASSKRTVIIATNIAQTSLTLPGIRLVIDSGLRKISYYCPIKDTHALLVAPVSKSDADQRHGRGGRTGDGEALLGYTRAYYEQQMQEHDEGQMRTSDLTQFCFDFYAIKESCERSFEVARTGFPFIGECRTE